MRRKHIALITDLQPLNLKYGLQIGRRRPGDVRQVTRLGTRHDYGADIRTRWAKGVVDLEDDQSLVMDLDASAKGGVLPFLFIPDENENDAWIDPMAETALLRSAIADLLRDWKDVPPRFATQMARFHQSLETGAPLPVTTADSRRALEIVTAFYYSSRTGEQVVFPIGRDHPNYHSWLPEGFA